jgi:3-methyl-2-oxobutanoate hydroxymethyltransferase
VKLEGGREVLGSVERILTAGIPVMGHLGLTPQSIYKFGTYVVRAKEEAEAQRLREDAKLLEQAGCFALVLEKIPARLATEVAASVSIPVIGIGAGNATDAQVLVMHDMLGINLGKNPKFVRNFMTGTDSVQAAMAAYVAAVKNGQFPDNALHAW